MKKINSAWLITAMVAGIFAIGIFVDPVRVHAVGPPIILPGAYMLPRQMQMPIVQTRLLEK